MDTKGKWDPSQVDEWTRRHRQVVEVPVETTVERSEAPRGPVAPEAFAPPAKKNHGTN